jgi:DNA primase
MFDPQELEDLRKAADLPALLRSEGVKLSASSGGFRSPCPLHGGDNPTAFSAFLDAKNSWRWKCHSHDCGSGDAISYLQKRHDLSFVDAVNELASFIGFQLSKQTEPFVRRITRPLPSAPMAQERAYMDDDAQISAALAFLAILNQIPRSRELGVRYGATRGIPATTLDSMGSAWYLTSEDLKRIQSWLELPEKAALKECLVSAGIAKVKEGQFRMNWWGKVVLFPCLTMDGEPSFFTARRLEWNEDDKIGKYIHQSTAQGAKLHCYSLPSIKNAAKRGESLNIVEGVFDALGAQALGFHAIAMLRRPEAKGWTDHTSSSIRALEPHLKLMRSCSSIDVIPDQDPGESGAVGLRKAEGLVSWLRGLGFDSSVLSMGELGFADCKDFGEAAMRNSNV